MEPCLWVSLGLGQVSECACVCARVCMSVCEYVYCVCMFVRVCVYASVVLCV